MYNRFKNSEKNKRGKLAEQLFVKLATKRNFTVEKAGLREDKTKHWDYQISKAQPNGFYKRKIDVKAPKNVDGKLNDDFIWIELQNVGGGKGWLYGEADGIAFQMNDFFALVSLEDLQELVHNLVDLKQEAKPSYSKKDPYVIYHRKKWHNDDLIVLIKKEDLLTLDHTRWYYKGERYENS